MSSQRSELKDKKKLFLILFFLLIVFAALWSHLPTQDSVDYFNFADQRSLFEIPNFFDVASNLFFAMVGVYGIIIFFKSTEKVDFDYRLSFLCLSVGVFATSLGSAYFHWQPQPDTLLWDRLPMAVGFASLLALFLRDNFRIPKFPFLLMLLITSSLLAVWNITSGFKDLRPYLVVQFGFLALILALVVLINKGRIPKKYLALAVIFYVLAKVLEGLDRAIFDAVGISGHTLKHIAAATGILYLNQGVYQLFVVKKKTTA